MPSKIAGYLVDLMIAKYHDDGLVIKKHLKPNSEGNKAEVVWEDATIHLYPHTRREPVGRSVLHELLHWTFDAGDEVHDTAKAESTPDPVWELERLVWRGLDRLRREALNVLAEEE